MGIVVPKVRKHLSADALLRSLQDVFSQVPEHRKGDPEIPLGDALMAAFAMFSLKSPSLLTFDKMRAEDIYALDSMQHLFEALGEDLEKPTPTLASDSG